MIVWKQGFQNHHDNKSKRFFFQFALVLMQQILGTSLCSFGFPNSKFYGHLHHRALKTSLLRVTARTNRAKVLISRQELKNRFLSFFLSIISFYTVGR